jgi:hypothetical protein
LAWIRIALPFIRVFKPARISSIVLAEPRRRDTGGYQLFR